MKKENLNVEITELFMAQADRDRRFYGTIKRERDDNGKHIVRGKIKVNDGEIYAIAGDQDTLGENLDEMVRMILDADIHNVNGVTTNIAGTSFFLS